MRLNLSHITGERRLVHQNQVGGNAPEHMPRPNQRPAQNAEHNNSMNEALRQGGDERRAAQQDAEKWRVATQEKYQRMYDEMIQAKTRSNTNIDRRTAAMQSIEELQKRAPANIDVQQSVVDPTKVEVHLRAPGQQKEGLVPKQTMDRIGDAFQQIAEAFQKYILPLIQQIQELVGEFKESLEYAMHGNSPATKEKFVDRQIKDGKFLKEHGEKTDSEITKIEDGLRVIPGGTREAKKGNIQDNIASAQSSIDDINTKIKGATGDEAKKLQTERDAKTTELKKLRNQLQTIDNQYARLAALEKRRDAISDRMSSAAGSATEYASTTTNTQKTETAESQKNVEQKQKATEKIAVIRTAINDGKKKDALQTNIEELFAILKPMKEANAEALIRFLGEQGFKRPESIKNIFNLTLSNKDGKEVYKLVHNIDRANNELSLEEIDA